MTWKQKKRFMRIAATIFLVMLIILFAFACCGSSEKVTYECREEERIEYAGIEEYEVKAFDTLSGIAVKYIPTDAYMQEWIDDVKRLNGRDDSTIYFGEVIKVYVFEK